MHKLPPRVREDFFTGAKEDRLFLACNQAKLCYNKNRPKGVLRSERTISKAKTAGAAFFGVRPITAFAGFIRGELFEA